ncbi:flavin reductase family protein [Allorhizobium pseudoryzae]|uniref:flavin reductase family protein n=1 Tax=Allorhizobium pseudoryzae TaxID=379684 RepID=UPI003D05AE32
MSVLQAQPLVSDIVLREAMRNSASGVAIVTTDGPAGRMGVTVSSFCSLSLSPPSVLVCVHEGSRALPAIIENGLFAVSLLSDDEEAVARAFAGQIPEFRDNKFAATTWQKACTGAPITENAHAGFDCRLSRQITFGTHAILIGEVLATVARPKQPLVYYNQGFHRATPLAVEGGIQ